jgi:hypothetical protein
MRRLIVFLFVVIMGLIALEQLAFATVILNSGGTTHLHLQARDTSVNMTGLHNEQYPTVLPYNYSFESTHGAAIGSGTYDFSDGGFHITTQQDRPKWLNSDVWLNGEIYFAVTTEIIYNASGIFSSVDPPSTPSTWTPPPYCEVYLWAKLTDNNTGNVLLNSEQLSNHTANAILTLGQLGGDDASGRKMVGSLTGILLPGHNYLFEYRADIYSADATWAETASGRIDLDLIPEPSALILLGMGAISLIAYVWRRKRAA